jgi:acyl-CoA synthetase (AMP-forming)/AMP-acid ligase II
VTEPVRASRRPTPRGGIGSLLAGAAARSPNLPALTLGYHDVTYGNLADAVDRVATRLTELETDLPGRRVAVIGSNVPALVVGMFAAWREGAVAVPLSARLREYDLSSILADAGPVAVVTVSAYKTFSLADLLARLLPQLPSVRGVLVLDDLGEVIRELDGSGTESADEPLDAEIGALLYTSGTTGWPKGALVQHARETGAAESLRGVLGLMADDTCVQITPIAHAFGLSCLLTAFAAGTRVVLADSSITVRPLLDAVRRHEATVLHGSPALFVSVLKAAPAGLPSVRSGFVGGAASPAGLLEQLDRVGMRILNLYGMTEIAAAACCRPDDPPAVRYTTAGRPLPGFEWRVEPTPSLGDVDGGELLVRGPWVTPGYFRREADTAAAFADGWFRTGDVGTFDDNGNLRITGRLKEVVHVAGFSVFPAEVEGFLLTHPDIAQAAVVGTPDEKMGEVLQAFVVPRDGAHLAPESVLQFARGKIADYKLPYRIRIVDELPLLATGKPDRLALRQLADAAATEAAEKR